MKPRRSQRKGGRTVIKRDSNYILRTAAGTQVLIPVGRAAIDFPGMVTVNETGAILWDLLEQERTEEELVQALYEKFDAELSKVAADVAEFLRRLRLAGALIEGDPAQD